MENTETTNLGAFDLPNKYWFTLKEACSLKNINYKTVCNQTKLQPNQGKMDGKIGGRKCFRRETILDWLSLTDDDINSQLEQKGTKGFF